MSHSHPINVTVTMPLDAHTDKEPVTDRYVRTRRHVLWQRASLLPVQTVGRSTAWQINQRGSYEAVTTGLQVTTTQPRQKIKRFAGADVRTQLNQYDFVVSSLAIIATDVTRGCSRTDAISSSSTPAVVSWGPTCINGRTDVHATSAGVTRPPWTRRQQRVQSLHIVPRGGIITFTMPATTQSQKSFNNSNPYDSTQAANECSLWRHNTIQVTGVPSRQVREAVIIIILIIGLIPWQCLWCSDHDWESLREFTRFTPQMQNSARWLPTCRPRRRTCANGPPVRNCETTSTIAI